MDSGALLAFFGPAYTGKSTFIRYLLDSRTEFAVAPLVSSRTVRPGESADATMSFAAAEELAALRERDGWFVDRVGGADYAVDLSAARRLRRGRHVIVGVAPPSLPRLVPILPEIVRVLFWPADFDLLQRRLAGSTERPPVERQERLAGNDRLRRDPPAADLRLTVPLVEDPAARAVTHHRLAEELLRALAGRGRG